MPLKCKYGKIRYRRKDVGRKGFHYLQVTYCPVRGKKKGRLVEAKLKLYKGRKKLGKVL